MRHRISHIPLTSEPWRWLVYIVGPESPPMLCVGFPGWIVIDVARAKGREVSYEELARLDRIADAFNRFYRNSQTGEVAA
jgi:hypothetical protein